MILVKWRNKLITVILLLFIFLELFSIFKITTMATFELKQTVFTYELGQEVSQNIEDYVICPDRIKKSLTLNLKRVNLNKVGNYNASIEYAGRDYGFKIKIVDTKKPTVKLKKLVYYVNPNQPLYAKNTVAEVNDASLTQIYFLKKENSEELVKEKSYEKVGTYIERVVVRDEQGNTSFPMRIKVIVANELVVPVIKGAEDKVIHLGDNFNAREGVTAYDNEDGDLTNKIVVTGKVQTNTVGRYTLTYTVTDSSKNMAKVTRAVEVIERSHISLWRYV
ncbi:bacterial group 3 Ig-like protein [Catenibacterium mitsuokai DSM 15897]|nr:bacterial group 3 Ig-like protein [Catenibacterium mitsuokai DSM 15897]